MENVITPGVEWGGRRKRSPRQPRHGLAEPAGRAAMTEAEQLAVILDLHRLRTQIDALTNRVAVLEDMAAPLERQKPELPLRNSAS